MFDLGYTAAAQGENSSWCEQFGPECVAGYDAYWERMLHLPMDESDQGETGSTAIENTLWNEESYDRE
ncbi:hypothetical protein HDIA_0716 [Hartmannibacter diazotrophicus]|uniref:Uncharacterized protein n=1 Tax=Hartmannibacter diazotrophicus TaxID=1482074 RepID=A0A2C9D1L3_9HYPH|nr:hypothetical protein [Hartmannibacter diazotrophicus]SON54257.1 hypothetical protein HDIA_0716 [Hartmannibacter diazotrophicus]